MIFRKNRGIPRAEKRFVRSVWSSSITFPPNTNIFSLYRLDFYDLVDNIIWTISLSSHIIWTISYWLYDMSHILPTSSPQMQPGPIFIICRRVKENFIWHETDKFPIKNFFTRIIIIFWDFSWVQIHSPYVWEIWGLHRSVAKCRINYVS